MPIRFQDEILYRKTQRQLGEILVALRLTLDAQKQNPGLPGLDVALDGLLRAKSSLMVRVKGMEDRADG